ncbi:unnamed protein product [Trichobilharzia regenti]|nr:unnamed protein product [Trichobilharzia regenti]
MMAMDMDCEMLVVGARCGLIEILRPDSLITCIQRFSVLNPSITNDSTNNYLTGLCLIPRPDWLSDIVGIESLDSEVSSKSDYSSEKSTGSNTNVRACSIEPFKRHFGWRLDDTRSDVSLEEANLFMDDFFTSNTKHAKHDGLGSEELQILRKEIDRVTASNRELLRRLINFELRTCE